MASKPRKKKILIILGRILDRLIADLDNDILAGINHDMAETYKQVIAALETEDEANWSPFQNSLYAVVDILGEQMEQSEDDPVDAYADVVATLG